MEISKKPAKNYSDSASGKVGGAIGQIIENRSASENPTKEARKFSILYEESQIKDVNELIKRAKLNSKLAFALKYAGANNIKVYVEDRFYISSKSWVVINIRKPDDKIVRFLMG